MKKTENVEYGYCRISTKIQSIERQERNILTEFPKAIIYKEAFTGTKIDRPEWNWIFSNASKGDTIIFDSVSRMSRNAQEGTAAYFELYDRGVNLVFLKERHIDTRSYQEALDGIISVKVSTGEGATDKLVNSIMEAVNEFMRAKVKSDIERAFEQSQKEVDDLHQRTKEGIQSAREKGKQIGQRKGIKLTLKDKEPIKKIIRKYLNVKDVSDRRVMAIINDEIYRGRFNKYGKAMKISETTFYKYKREVLKECENEKR